MIKKITLLFLLLLNVGTFAQNQSATEPTTASYISKKGVYEITYNTEHWQKSNEASLWDAEFQDNYNLINVYFIELNYFVTDKNLKTVIKDQYNGLGEIKDLKISKKTINGMKVNYFECELESNDYVYVYQGFLYNGKAGTMEVQFSMQKEAVEQSQAKIDEFCKGIKEIK